MAAVDGNRWTNICCYPFTVLAKVICFPCTLIKRIWEAVKSIFIQIRGPTAEEIEQKQRQYVDLTKQLSEVQKQINPHAAPAPPPINAKMINLGKRAPLTVEGHHSEAIQNLRILAKQIVTILAHQIISKAAESLPKEAAINLSDDEWDAILADVGHLCDLLTDQLASRLDDPKFFPMLYDKIMTYLVEEAKAHVVAANNPNYVNAISVKNYADHVIESSKVPERKNDELAHAEGVKVEQAKLGGERLLQEIYYDTYRKTKADDDETIRQNAHQIALAERNEKAQNWGDNRKEKPKDWRSWFPTLDANVHTRSIELYLQDLYSQVFVHQKGACSDGMVNIFKAMHGMDEYGQAQIKFRNHIDRLVNSLLEPTLSAALKIVGTRFLESTLFKKIVPIVLGQFDLNNLNFDTEKFIETIAENKNMITDIIEVKIPIREKLIELLEKWILPSELMNQLASNIYPSLQKQLLKMICRKLILARWSDYAPVIYAFITDGTDAKTFKSNLWTEMNAHERTFSLAESGNPFSRDSFNNIMDELLESFQREQIIARKVMNELPSKEFNELAADFTHLIQVEHEDEKNQRRASIKAHIIQACDVYDKDPLKQQKLDSRLKILSQHLDPLVAKIEMRLLDVKGKTHAHQWTKALIAQTIKQAVDGEALEMTSFFGDLAMQMGCNFAHAAPWLEKFQLLWSNTIKGTVNQSASAAMEGYRVSPDELAKTTTETLEAKLSKNDKSGLDPDRY